MILLAQSVPYNEIVFVLIVIIILSCAFAIHVLKLPSNREEQDKTKEIMGCGCFAILSLFCFFCIFLVYVFLTSQ